MTGNGSNITRIRLCWDGQRFRCWQKSIVLCLLQIIDELCCCRWHWLCLMRCRLESREE
jgi:hypothetical protein